MSKTKSISDLVLSLQKENQRLQLLGKYFNKICKSEFGYGTEDLHKIVNEYTRNLNIPQSESNELE